MMCLNDALSAIHTKCIKMKLEFASPNRAERKLAASNQHQGQSALNSWQRERGEAIGSPHFDSHFKTLDKKLACHSRAIFAHQLLQRGIFGRVRSRARAV